LSEFQHGGESGRLRMNPALDASALPARSSHSHQAMEPKGKPVRLLLDSLQTWPDRRLRRDPGLPGIALQ